ncbi:MAG: FHA domain-containing protein [Candidatus Hydrogenedentes bacterium]|nr:FHA domain-containing protein [Candidatus Hydrogenedentota bacterium]
MSQLVIEQPGVPTQTLPLSAEETHLGRAEDNHVVLVADEVSRHHAKICRRGDKFILVDLNSLNGTYVNRQRVVQRILSDADEIWFGSKCHLIFREDARPEPAAKPPKHDSTLIQGLDKIRAEMDRVGSSMTMIGKLGHTPVPDEDEPPLQPTPDELVAMSRAYRRLAALYEASKLLASDFDLSKRLAKVLDTAIEVMEAERGFVMLRDETTDGLKVSLAREMGQDLHASSPSMGIAGRAAIDGEPVLWGRSQDDAEFGLRESIIRQNILSAMCVPLKVEDRVLGSIYVDTRKIGHTFTEQDLELFASLAAQSAMAIENVQLYERAVEDEKKRANLGRFLSPAIVDMVMKKDTALELGGNKTIVTTMFCDIRSFTQIAERISPNLLVDMLNEHFTAMTDIIFRFSGTLDKFIGDEIMAVFGAPISSRNDAHRAIQAAITMQSNNAQLNQKRSQAGQPVFEMGIGIDTGDVIAGYVGSPERMEFTVVGDRVNTARRLCQLAGGGQVVAGANIYELVQDIVEARPIGTVMLKNKAEPVQAYEILSLKTSMGAA